jgi:hypothetical protein
MVLKSAEKPICHLHLSGFADLGNFSESAPNFLWGGNVVENESEIGLRKLRPQVELQAIPNPFNAQVVINCFSPTNAAMVGMIDIYNITGQKIWSKEVSLPDHGEILWFGKDLQGRNVASGQYLVRFSSPGISHPVINKIVLLK